MTATREYVLGTDQAEFDRLGFQHSLWSNLAHQTWMQAGIAPGMKVLDVGCGPGFAAIDLARIVGPSGHVIAVDESVGFIERLREESRARVLPQIEAHVGDVQALETVGIGEGSIDLAYARWVLCFVANPGSVLRAVARLLKPGGRFAVNDYFNYETMTIAPKHPDFTRGILAVGRSWRDRGGNPDVVGDLPRLAAEAGLRQVHLSVHQRLARPTDTMWHWPDTFWKSYIPRLVTSGHLSESEAAGFMGAWERASKDANAFMTLPPVFEGVWEKAAAR